MGHTKKHMPRSQSQGTLFNKGWVGTWFCNHHIQAYVFLLEKRLPSTPQPVPASCACRLWVTGLAGLHLQASPDKNVKRYVSRVTTGHFPRARCLSGQLPQCLPLTPAHSGLSAHLYFFPQDSSRFTRPSSLPQCAAYQHISFFCHTLSLLSKLSLRFNVPHLVVKGLLPPQLAPSTLTLELWFSAPVASIFFFFFAGKCSFFKQKIYRKIPNIKQKVRALLT